VPFLRKGQGNEADPLLTEKKWERLTRVPQAEGEGVYIEEEKGPVQHTGRIPHLFHTLMCLVKERTDEFVKKLEH